MFTKIALMIALYLLFIAPQPRADTSPSGVQQHLLDGTHSIPAGDSP